MLMLTRKIGEQIVIGDNHEITLTVVAMEGGRIKLGIQADATIPVHRVEGQGESFESWSHGSNRRRSSRCFEADMIVRPTFG